MIKRAETTSTNGKTKTKTVTTYVRDTTTGKMLADKTVVTKADGDEYEYDHKGDREWDEMMTKTYGAYEKICSLSK